MNMERTATNLTRQRKIIHPHKFAMWIAMGSISMMFAGLTSGYMVRQAEGNWRYFNLPAVFWYSTIVILLSSVTMVLGIKAFKERKIPRYRMLILSTIIMGLVFSVLQFKGFYDLYHYAQPVRMNGQVLNESLPVKMNGNPSESFLLIIAGMHIAHILGGVIALIIVFFKSFRTRVKVYDATGLEIVGSYWHFVDILWIYLFIFFLANQ